MKIIINAIKEWVDAKISRSVAGLATEEYVDQQIESIPVDELATEEYVDQQIESIIGVEIVQSDWNANDETSNAYIKNRPFYEGIAEVVILPETTISADNLSAKLNQSLIKGQTYRIIWNGIEYNCVARDYDGCLMLGNNAIYEYDNGIETDTGEPFAMDVNGDDLRLHIYTNDETATLTIMGLGKKTYKIDKKYLPDDINLGLLKTGTQLNLPTQHTWSSIVYGNGTFVVAATDYNNVFYSYDGINWNEAETGSSKAFMNVSYANGMFFASEINSGNSFGEIFYSYDGINWHEAVGGAHDAIDKRTSSVAYGNGVFVAAPTGGVSAPYSYDGINWKASKMQNNHSLSSVAYGNGMFVAVGNLDAIYSYDGINWNENQIAKYGGIWSHIVYGNGMFVAVGSGDSEIAYSYDGINWNTKGLTNSAFTDLIYENGMFIATVTDGRVFYSYDGVDWNVANHNYSNSDCWDYSLTSVAYGNDMFVAISDNQSILITSIDGINWNDISEWNDVELLHDGNHVLKPVAKAIKKYINIESIFGIETYEVGQIPVVKSVDNNGKPIVWETASFGAVTNDEIDALFQ